MSTKMPCENDGSDVFLRNITNYPHGAIQIGPVDPDSQGGQTVQSLLRGEMKAVSITCRYDRHARRGGLQERN